MNSSRLVHMSVSTCKLNRFRTGNTIVWTFRRVSVHGSSALRMVPLVHGQQTYTAISANPTLQSSMVRTITILTATSGNGSTCMRPTVVRTA